MSNVPRPNLSGEWLQFAILMARVAGLGIAAAAARKYNNWNITEESFNLSPSVYSYVYSYSLVALLFCPCGQSATVPRRHHHQLCRRLSGDWSELIRRLPFVQFFDCWLLHCPLMDMGLGVDILCPENRTFHYANDIQLVWPGHWYWTTDYTSILFYKHHIHRLLPKNHVNIFTYNPETHTPILTPPALTGFGGIKNARVRRVTLTFIKSSKQTEFRLCVFNFIIKTQVNHPPRPEMLLRNQQNITSIAHVFIPLKKPKAKGD